MLVRKRQFYYLSAVLMLVLINSGCVSRRMTIRSDPPGALVQVNGENIGHTPVSKDFTHYGGYDITLIKDGYSTVRTQQEVIPPWYQRFPFDFFSDNFLPYRVTNRHEFRYSLQPKMIVPNEELENRANGLRSQALVGP